MVAMRGRKTVVAGAGSGGADGARRRWPRLLGLVAVLAVAAVPVVLQVQLRATRDEVARVEAAGGVARDDVRSAAARVLSVDDRAAVAEAEEDAAQAELDRVRTVMTALGLRQPSLEDVQVETGSLRDAYRTQYEGETAAVAVQERVEPAAGSCIFDRLRVLARVAIGHQPGAPSPECTTVAGARPGRG